MPELHDRLDRRASGHEPPPDLFERVLDRHRRRDRNRRIGSALVALSVMAVVIGGLLWSVTSDRVPASGGVTGERSTATGATTPPFDVTTEAVAFEAGTYRIPRSTVSVADVVVTFPEGWTVQHGDTFVKHPDTDEALGFNMFVVDAIYADACEGSEGELAEVGPSVDDLATALLQQPGPEASGPVATSVAGYPATQVDLTAPGGFALKKCNLGNVLQIWFSPPDHYFVLPADDTASVYIVDIEGQRQVFVTQVGSKASDEDVQELQAILDSVRIEP